MAKVIEWLIPAEVIVETRQPETVEQWLAINSLNRNMFTEEQLEVLQDNITKVNEKRKS